MSAEVAGVRYPAIILAVLLASSATAQADGQDRLVVYGGFGSGAGGMYGKLGKDFDSNIVRSTLHGGVRIGEVSLSWNLTMGMLGSNNPPLHGRDLLSLAFGPNARYTFGWPNDVAQLYVRGGFHRVWWWGSDKVSRTCEQTGSCTAGFYQESPAYAGFAARMGIGMQITPPMPRRRDPYMHFALDLGYQLMNMKLITDRQTGHMITASIQIAFGGGRKGLRR